MDRGDIFNKTKEIIYASNDKITGMTTARGFSEMQTNALLIAIFLIWLLCSNYVITRFEKPIAGAIILLIGFIFVIGVFF